MISYAPFLLLLPLAYGSPVREGRNIDSFCNKQSTIYRRYCDVGMDDFDRDTQTKLTSFCSEFEEKCLPLSGKAEMIIPPSLPKSGDFRFRDMPVDIRKSTPRIHVEGGLGSDLTPEIVSLCTPDCTAVYCTTICKCAHTHPKVHSMCNPPSSADLANTCQNWYAQCPMFHQLSY